MSMRVPEKPALPLPLTAAEIDSAWLTSALRSRAPGVTVLASGITEIIAGTCTKIRVRLEMDEAGRRAGIPERVILKGGFEPHSRDYYFMHVMEARAYDEVLPVLKLPSPACYFAATDDERQQGIVILEDLRARGVRFCDPLVPQTRPQVTRRLTELARFHARTWNSAELGPGGRWHWLKEPLTRGYSYFSRFLQPEVWKRHVAAPQAAAASVYFHDPAWMSDALERLVVLAARLPHAVLHGDTHLGNLYIDTDGTPGFFDPQPHRWPAMLETTYHIGGALDPMDRRRWEVDLLAHYLDELRRNGVEPPALDEALSQYAAFLAFGFCIFLINDTHFQPAAINTAYVARFSAAMIDNNTLAVLKAIGPAPAPRLPGGAGAPS